MKTKTLLSIVALSAVVAGGANAAISKEQCIKSMETIWVENVKNADGSKGACVPKNACNTYAFKKKFCNEVFLNIQVCDIETARALVDTYARNVLQWKKGCTSFIDVSVDNAVGDDYIGCYSNGNYMTFRFDDTNEKICAQGQRDYDKGLCLALGGEYGYQNNTLFCNGISKQTCINLTGDESAYVVGDFSCNMGKVNFWDRNHSLDWLSPGWMSILPLK